MRRVVVTRPAAQAGEAVRGLQARGVDAVALPLIEIVPLADPSPLMDAWRALPGTALLVFVSVNAVEAFFAARPAGCGWPSGCRAAGPGAGTAEALRRAGVPPAAIVAPSASAAFADSESLWAQLADDDWRGATVRVVRGGAGRAWLAEQLGTAGATVVTVDAYARRPPALSAAEQGVLDDVLARPQAHAWWFGSSEAIGHLQAIASAGRWSAGLAIASHPRIAAAATSAGFGRVFEVGTGLDAVVACIQSLRP